MPRPCPFVYDDGGRRQAGFRGDTGDCVVRAITIACAEDYQVVYDELNHLGRELAATARPNSKRRRRLERSSSRTGVDREVLRRYLADRGWRWTPTMGIGTGCTVHLRPDELPGGWLIVDLSGHLAAVVDGTVHDTVEDVAREGDRCVYGYWQAPDA